MILSLLLKVSPSTLQESKIFNRTYTIVCCVYLALYSLLGGWALFIFNVDLGFSFFKYVQDKHKNFHTPDTSESVLLTDDHSPATPKPRIKAIQSRSPEWETENFQPYVPTVQDTIKNVSKTIFSI